MPEVSDHLVKSLMRLVRQSTTVPNTSNTSAFTADTSDMRASPLFLSFLTPSFRGDAQHRTRNLEIPGSRFAAPGMTARLRHAVISSPAGSAIAPAAGTL